MLSEEIDEMAYIMFKKIYQATKWTFQFSNRGNEKGVFIFEILRYVIR